MEEKIYQLIKERNPWLLRDSFLSKTIYTLLKKYLRYDETVFVGDHIQSMTEKRLLIGWAVSIQVTLLLKVLKIYQKMESF